MKKIVFVFILLSNVLVKASDDLEQLVQDTSKKLENYNTEELEKIANNINFKLDKIDDSEILTLTKFSNKKVKKEFNKLTNDNVENEAKNLVPESNNVNALIFISFSMPESFIVRYIEEAKIYNATLVLMGLLVDKNTGKPSIPFTAKKIMDITNQKGGSIIVHPKLFERFNVSQVPAIVKLNSYDECIINGGECEHDKPLFDKITGSVSIGYALETFNNDL